MLELDLKNLNCPLPVLKTKKFLSSLAGGEQVKIMSTDPASLFDLQDFCKKTGHKLINQTQNDGIITTIIEHR
ncbi:MAG: tRNA 2-thiouridine synthesizing protein [Pseudomonadota bacterium]|nr:tRNA 2-thiouridine synthesizing protein [Pseudomonadota bacterium]